MQARAGKLVQQRERLLDLVTEGDRLAEKRYRALGVELEEVEAEIEKHAIGSWTAQPLRVDKAAVESHLEEIRTGLEADDIKTKQNVIKRIIEKVEIGDRGETDENGWAIDKAEQRFAKVTYRGTILGITLNGNGVLPTSCSSMKRKSI